MPALELARDEYVARLSGQEPLSPLNGTPLVVRLRLESHALRSLERSLDASGEPAELPLDAVLRRFPAATGRPLFGDPAPANARRVAWRLSEERAAASTARSSDDARDLDALNVLTLPREANAEDIARGLVRDPRIVYAEPPPVREPLAVGEDDHFAAQWNLHSAGFLEAWQLVEPLSATPVPVAVIDCGLSAHPDLPRPALYETFGASPEDTRRGHGTKVCGVLAATRWNSEGIAGAAICALHVYKVFTPSFHWEAYYEALRRVADSGVRVLNLSLGERGFRNAEADLVARCVAAGVVVVAASGNEGASAPPLYPAALPDVVAVGSTDRWNNVASDSSGGSHVLLCAPGEDVPTTWDEAARPYGTVRGTSFAAPLVAAACVQLFRRRPTLTPVQVRAALTRLATPLAGQHGWHPRAGYGRLDLRRLAHL
jgi:subtilisin family serine protease